MNNLERIKLHFDYINNKNIPFDILEKTIHPYYRDIVIVIEEDSPFCGCIGRIDDIITTNNKKQYKILFSNGTIQTINKVHTYFLDVEDDELQTLLSFLHTQDIPIDGMPYLDNINAKMFLHKAYKIRSILAKLDSNDNKLFTITDPYEWVSIGKSTIFSLKDSC